MAPANIEPTRRLRTLVDSLRPAFAIITGDLVRDALRVLAFVGLHTVDIDDQWYFGHVDSRQRAWLERDLAHMPFARE